MIISTLLSTWRSLRPSLGLIRPIELSLSSFSSSSFFLHFCHPPCLRLSCPLLHPHPQGWTPALLLSHKPNCLPAPLSLSSPRLSALLFISRRSNATFLRFHLPLASTSRPHIQTGLLFCLFSSPFFPLLFNSVLSVCFLHFHSFKTQFYQVSQKSSQQEMVRLCNPWSAL